MDAQTWQLISIIGYSLAGLLLITAIILFFKMNIRAVIGDLTGRTAAKQIQEIREQNARTGNKRYRPSAFNLERGKLTEPVGSRRLTGKKERGTTKGLRKFMTRGLTGETSRPGITKNLPTDTLPKSPVPVHLRNSGAVTKDTTVLTDELLPVGDETTVLNNGAVAKFDVTTGNKAALEIDATTVLGSEVASTLEATTVLGNEEAYATTELDKGKDILIEETGDMSYGTEVLEQGIEGGLNDPEALENGTEVLMEGTAVLNDETYGFDRGTEVLTEDAGTTVLNPTEDLSNEEHISQAVDFKIVKDIKIIHTDRVI